METAYRNWDKGRSRTQSRRTAGKHRARLALGTREQRRLAQLLVCVALFLLVFIGKGVFPERLVSLRENLSELMSTDTDFRAAFASLGRSISSGEPVIETMGGLFVEVFGGSRMTPAQPLEKLLPSYEAERTFLSEPTTVDSLIKHRFGVEATPEPTPAPAPSAEPVQPEPSTPPPAESAPAEEPAVVPMEYNGPAMPANATMDKYKLGLEKTVCPVSGWWESSGFGWREHPVDGGEKFHHGLDMAVNDGTSVRAFADGVVDYIGESPDIYGLYLQLRHANGVTTFYAHNSKLLVGQGQSVKAGDIIAQSGDTGNVTGPHLHFEIKKDGILLNPLYYVDKGA